MIRLGDYNILTVVKAVDFGLYLDGGDRWDEILLPREDVPEGLKPGDQVEVFIYFDSEDRIVATTRKPEIIVGNFAYMEVVSVSDIGAFLDWGLRKDLLLPFKEQQYPVRVGEKCLVYAYVDMKTFRIAATTKIDKYLDQIYPDYTIGQEVEILIARKSDLGYNVIVDNTHWGLVYKNEVFKDILPGMRTKGYVKNIREDDKLDISLQPIGYDRVQPLAGKIMEELKKNGGKIAISDKSSPELIKEVFGCSKKAYKMALGTLLKKGFITLEPDKISLLEEE